MSKFEELQINPAEKSEKPETPEELTTLNEEPEQMTPKQQEEILDGDAIKLAEARETIGVKKGKSLAEMQAENDAKGGEKMKIREMQNAIYLYLKTKFMAEKEGANFFGKFAAENKIKSLIAVSHLKNINLAEMFRQLERKGVKIDSLNDPEILEIGDKFIGAESFKEYMTGQLAKNEKRVAEHVSTDLPGMVGRKI